MNLQALFILQDQLNRLAIAGTSLLENDFRLPRSLEALAPLAAASPVFAKIREGLQKLLEAPKERRNSILLDLLALVNAVVYTQGSCGCAGDLTEQQTEPGRYLELRYSQLKEILEPITSKGSGRLVPIQELWKQHPEYFTDYRLIYQLVKALDENYAELGTLYVKILHNQLEEGNFSPKLLEEDFDPAGKRNMVRRVQILAYAAEAQKWLLEQLPKAQKGVKEAIILALGKDKNNLPILLDLINTEKGKNLQAVFRALAYIDTYETQELWETELNKNHLEAIQLLAGSPTPLAAEIIAKLFIEVLQKLASGHKDNNTVMTLSYCLETIVGKWSAAIENSWYQAAELAKNIHNMPTNFGEITTRLAATLAKSLVLNPCDEAKDTAKNLAERYPAFLCVGFLADALTLSSEALYNKYADKIVRKSFFKWESKRHREASLQITAAISWICHDKIKDCDAIPYSYIDYLTNISFEGWRSIDKLDIRWFSLLTDPNVVRPDSGSSFSTDLPIVGGMYYSLEQIMAWLIDSNDPARCKIIGDFLFKSAKKSKDIYMKPYYFKHLKQCGWNDSELAFL